MRYIYIIRGGWSGLRILRYECPKETEKCIWTRRVGGTETPTRSLKSPFRTCYDNPEHALTALGISLNRRVHEHKAKLVVAEKALANFERAEANGCAAQLPFIEDSTSDYLP
jgi:hypothetical protein